MLHIFGKWPINIQSCSEKFRQMFPDCSVKVLVFCDVMYCHCMGKVTSMHLRKTLETLRSEDRYRIRVSVWVHLGSICTRF